MIALLVVMVLGLGTRFYAAPGAAWVADSLGGAFYVAFWVLLFLVARPGASPVNVSLWVLGITCALEVLQLWHPPFLERIRDTVPGRALIGTTFVWSDFVYYVVGAAVALIIARLVARPPRGRRDG